MLCFSPHVYLTSFLFFFQLLYVCNCFILLFFAYSFNIYTNFYITLVVDPSASRPLMNPPPRLPPPPTKYTPAPPRDRRWRRRGQSRLGNCARGRRHANRPSAPPPLPPAIPALLEVVVLCVLPAQSMSFSCACFSASSPPSPSTSFSSPLSSQSSCS